MIKAPSELWRRYDGLLEARHVHLGERGRYRKWLRYYLDFCHKYQHSYTAANSLGPFLEKLASKNQSGAQREQASEAVKLYWRMVAEGDGPQGSAPGSSALNVKSKEPGALSTEDVKRFLTDLAVRQSVSASTQNQAFNALLFFFRHVLGREFGKVDGVVRAKRRRYIPVVLSRSEVDAVITHLGTPHDLIVKLLYGCGLRISECTELRVHCFNLSEMMLTVHDGKGQKERRSTRRKSSSGSGFFPLPG